MFSTIFFRLLISVLVSLMIAVPVSAQEDDIADLSLDDLLNTKVEVASKKAQKITDAPAIISVITAEDIKNMGTDNIYEVLSYVPGVNIIETYFGYTSVTFRGNMQTHYNNKSLLLINNHPIYNVINGSYYLETLPVSIIKRIEVIRGPGSTLYGTNAFAGVVRIVTKNGEDLKGGELAVSGGSFETINPSIVYGNKFNDFSTSMAFNYLNTKGYPYNVVKSEDGTMGEFDYKNNVTNVFVSAAYKGLVFNGGHAHNRKSKFGLIPTLTSTGERELDTWFADLSYNKKISDKFALTFLSYFDQIKKRESVGWYPPVASAQNAGVGEYSHQKYKGYKMGFEVQGEYSVNENTRLIAGANYEYLKADPYTLNSDATGEVNDSASAVDGSKSSYDISGYLQVETRIVKQLGVIGGLRYNKNKEYGSSLAPRAGLVFNASDKLTFKLLYGKAFRNPNFFEKFVDTKNILVGKKDLDPETINTVDFGADIMLGKKNNLRVNLYYLTTEKQIARTAVIPAGQDGHTRDTPGYANSDGVKITGLEAELKGLLFANNLYFLNGSFILSNEDKMSGKDINYIAKVIVNAGVNLKVAKALTLSPYFQYIGKREGYLSSGDKSSEDAYVLLNLNMKYKVSEKLSVMISGRNLLNKKYYYPEYIRRNLERIPGGHKFAVYGKVVYSF